MSSSSNIDAYFERVSSMSTTEKDVHLRKFYKDESQSWPDYLDYLDEWHDYHRDFLSKTRKDFIYHYLAKRQAIIHCGDHTHQFFTNNDESISSPHRSIFFPSPDTYIIPSSCWYQHILSLEDSMSDKDLDQESIRLTHPEIEAVKRFNALQLAKEGITPILLDFETFKKEWWSQSSVSKAMDIYKKSFPPALRPRQQQTSPIDPAPTTTIFKELKTVLPEAKNQWFHWNVTDPIIMDNSRVYEDHGLHLLVLAHPNYQEVINVINQIRTQSQPDSCILFTDISNAMSTCSQCAIYHDMPSHIRPHTTVPCVLYSPPGNGKSTALSNGFFIGVDTDWLIRNSDFNTIIAPFLKLGVAVITNQFELATNSGEKFLGSYNTTHLRKTFEGQPFTPLPEILAAQKMFGPDFTLDIKTSNHHFEHDVLQLLRQHFLYNQSRIKFMHKKPLVKFTDYTPSRQPFSSIIEMLSNSSPVNQSRRRQRRRKT